MHKGITLLVLGTIFCAMGIIFYIDVSRAPVATSEKVVLVDSAQLENTNDTPEYLASGGLPKVLQSPNVALPQTPAPSAIPSPASPERLAPPARQSPERPAGTPAERYVSVVPSTLSQEIAEKVPPHQSVEQMGSSDLDVAPTISASTSPALASPTLTAQTVAPPVLIDEGKLSRTGKHNLSDISLAESAEGVVLRIRAQSSFPVSIFSLKEPHRLVIDLPGTWQNMRIPEVPHGSFITNIRLGTHKTGPRLVLDLAKEVTYTRARPDAHSVDVVIK